MIGSTNSIWKINGRYEQLVNYTMLYDGSLGDVELNECKDSIACGWTSTYYYSNTNSYWNRNTDSLEAGVTVKRSSTANWRTTNKIGFTGYSYAGIVAKTSRAVTFGLKLTPSTSGYVSSGEKHFTTTNRVDNTKYIAICDLSNVTNSMYIASYQNADGAAFTYYVYEVALFKADDWATLANLAGITATSIDDIINNCTTVLSNKDAVEFMIYNCTGDFMVNAIHSTTFLTALNNSQYKTKIWANEHWAKFLNMVA